MSLLSRWRLERQRTHAEKAVTNTALRDVLQAPLPADNAAFEDVRFLAVDFETTGLDLQNDKILSIGTVPIEGGALQLGQARYDVIDFSGTLNEETLAIHGLTHDALALGIPIEQALENLLKDMTGAVMVAHQSAIEHGFLSAACEEHFGGPCHTLWVCTLLLERHRTASAGEGVSVRLGQSRERYNLPRYKAHHALIDAMAGAELLLAQAAHISPKGCKLKDLL